VVVKLGADGACERRRSPGDAVPGDARHGGFPLARPADPVGAGDAFVAGYLAAMLEGLEGSAALALGNACGAAVAATVGDVTGAPTRAEADAIIAAGSADVLR
jgi:2-dehydro-3-deoxygluconokinase